MTWYAWALVVYIVCDRLLTIAWIGRSVEITHTAAIATVLTGALAIWAIVELAGKAAA